MPKTTQNGKANKSATNKADKAAKTAKKAAKVANQAAQAARRDHHPSKNPGSQKIAAEVQAVAFEHRAEMSAARDLAKALSVPGAFPSFRVQDGYSSLPTACSSPFMVEQAAFSSSAAGTVDSLGVPVVEGWAFAFRDPRRALVFYDASSRTARYTAVNEEGSIAYSLESNQQLSPQIWEHDSGIGTYAPHGPFLHAGVVKSGPGSDMRFIPGQSNQTLSFSGLPPSTSVTVNIYLYIGGEVVQYRRVANTDADGAWEELFSDFRSQTDDENPPPPFFLWGGIMCSSPMSPDGSVGFGGSNIPWLRQLTLADWDDVENVIEKIRFNALDLMFSNTAPPLSRGGFACAWQVPSNIDPIALMQEGFDELADRPGAVRMEATEGIHIFWKSTDASDWEYLEVGNADDSVTGSASGWLIEADSDYLAIALNIPPVEGRAGYWTVSTDVQYRHDSVWFGQGYPEHNRHTFELALEIQGRIPQVHCNPFHIKDIFKWVSNNKQKIQKTGDLFNQTSGYRLAPITETVNSLLDTWF